MIGIGALAAILLLVTAAGPSRAATIEIRPQVAGASEEFETVANALEPGDELVLRGGVYSQTGRRAIVGLNGTADRPIVIRAADGERPVLTRPAEQIDTHNNIEIESSSHLILRGLAFRGGSTGVRFIGGHHITLEDSEIYETGNNAIAMNSGNYDAFVIRRNHIHHTGLSTEPTEGEGMYLGCNNDACRVTNSLIEGNYIHHLRGTSDGGNDGIEVKVGSHGNVIRDNVIHDTNIGTRFPCILVYGGGPAPNIVEGNAVWSCGEGIQVVSDAVVRNNIVLGSAASGITAAPHVQVARMRNVTIAGNTVFGHPTCLYVRWSGASGVTLADNAAYCPGGTAVDAAGLDGEGVTVRANRVEGRLAGASLDGVRFADGGSAQGAFRDPAALDLWPAPGSPLIGTADGSLAPTFDFNATRRTSPYDVGAYETEGLETNPGWRLGPGLKDASARDRVRPGPPTNVQAR